MYYIYLCSIFMANIIRIFYICVRILKQLMFLDFSETWYEEVTKDYIVHCRAKHGFCVCLFWKRINAWQRVPEIVNKQFYCLFVIEIHENITKAYLRGIYIINKSAVSMLLICNFAISLSCLSLWEFQTHVWQKCTYLSLLL